MSATDRAVRLDQVADRLARRRAPVTRGRMVNDVRESAVLCVLYEIDDAPHVLLTRRSPTMRHHSHEVSFPGGRRDADDPDLWATATREAAEEVGLDASSIELVGTLDRFVTVGSRTMIHPFVAVAANAPDVRVASPAEVEAVRHVSLHELLLDEVWREELWPLGPDNDERAITFFEIEGDTIWGATGAMLRQLLAVATGIDDEILGGPA